MTANPLAPLDIAEARCRVTFHPEWPLHQDREPDHGAVLQDIPSGGSVFLHYGPDRTLDSYVDSWRERYGSGARVTSDHDIVTDDGQPGRSVTVLLDEEVRSRLGDSRLVTPAQTLVCNGYTIQTVAVLLGYLVPRSTDQRTLSAADLILASLGRIG